MVGGENGQTVARTDDEITADDHVAVAITIGSGTKRQARTAVSQCGYQISRIYRVGIGVATAEIGQRRTVDHRTGWCAETIFENCQRIGAGDRVHGVKTHAKVRASQQTGNALEVEQGFEEFGVVGNRIDDADDHVADARNRRVGSGRYPGTRRCYRH
jgi:hypothetical protein